MCICKCNNAIRQHSGSDFNVSTARPQPTANSGCPPANNLPDPSSVEEDMPQELLGPATPPPQQKPRGSIAIQDKTVRVEGQDHVIRDVTEINVVISFPHLKMLQKKANQIDMVRQSIRTKKTQDLHFRNGCWHQPSSRHVDFPSLVSNLSFHLLPVPSLPIPI